MLADELRKSGRISKKRKTPVWKGPEEDGVTFSLLSRFLVCRERFRLLVAEGLKPADRWHHRPGYGDMWHICEAQYAADPSRWEIVLTEHGKDLCKRYPTQQDEIDTWYRICRTQFPLYCDYWSRVNKATSREKNVPLLQEAAFDVPYELPSKRVVRLRGKWDSVDLVGKGKMASVWLQENKTKGDIDQRLIVRQLSFDLQTMIYVIALTEVNKLPAPLVGVRYNVVRRPRQYQGKKETRVDFNKRLQGIIAAEPEAFFMRWEVRLTQQDVDRFRRECLDPILEQLCDWWEWVNSVQGLADNLWSTTANHGTHWRHPFGVYNPLDEGNASDLDEYLATGGEAGLQRTDNLFPELTICHK